MLVESLHCLHFENINCASCDLSYSNGFHHSAYCNNCKSRYKLRSPGTITIDNATEYHSLTCHKVDFDCMALHVKLAGKTLVAFMCAYLTCGAGLYHTKLLPIIMKNKVYVTGFANTVPILVHQLLT